MKKLLAVSGIVGIAMGAAGTAEAQRPPGCTAQLVICMRDASDLPTWWERSIAGLDCNLEYAACVWNLFN
jgi:hypothetical protein